jgi:hypothetical protein
VLPDFFLLATATQGMSISVSIIFRSEPAAAERGAQKREADHRVKRTAAAQRVSFELAERCNQIRRINRFNPPGQADN